MNIYHEVKKDQITLRELPLRFMEAQSPANPWVYQAAAFYLCFVLFCFFFLSEHTLTGFVSSL